MPLVGEVEGAHGGCELGGPGSAGGAGGARPLRAEGGGGMPQGREGHAWCGDPGPVCGGAAGALAPGATHGGGRRRTVWGARARWRERARGGAGGFVQEVRSSARVSAGRGTSRSLAPLPRWTWTWRRGPSRSETCRKRASWSRRPSERRWGRRPGCARGSQTRGAAGPPPHCGRRGDGVRCARA